MDDIRDDSTPTEVDKKLQPADNDTTVKAKKDSRTLMPPKEESGDEYSPAKMYMREYEYPPSWVQYEKMSKEDAIYKKGAPFHHCGICSYYQVNQCKIVRGYIAKEMGCKYFQKKYEMFGITLPTKGHR